MFGCGAAWLAKYLFSAGVMRKIQYEGLDVSESMCKYAKINCCEGTYHVADIMSFEPNRKWDIIMACGSIERFVNWRHFLYKLLQLSSSWVIIHKIFFTTAEKPTHIVEISNYNTSKEHRIVLNFVEFSLALEQYGFVIEDRYNWAGCVDGIIARKKLS
jgi:trans-aconitate methyltransferase